MNSALLENIFDVMQKVQQTSSCHQKCRNILVKLVQKADKNVVLECVDGILKTIVNQDPKERNSYLERAIDFWSLFCTAPELFFLFEEDFFLLKNVFEFLLQISNLENSIYRYRACQIINKLLHNLDAVEFDGDLYDKIENALLERLKNEGKSEVRFQAISAIYRLQNPNDLECQIIPSIKSFMCGDSVAKIRKICVQKIAIRKDTVEPVLSRIRDISSDVRLAAFQRLAKLAKYCKIGQKHFILRQGFYDEHHLIRTFVANELVQQWLESYDVNYLQLLKSIRMDADEASLEKTTAIAKLILEALFSCRSIEEILQVLNFQDCVVSYEELNWETVIFWRFLSETLRKSEEYEMHLSTILPNLVDFAQYIYRYVKDRLAKLTEGNELQFILSQLFVMTCGYEFGDSVNCRALNGLVASILKMCELSASVTATVVNCLSFSILNVNNRSIFVCEIISDIAYPMEEAADIDVNVQIAGIKVQINCLNEELQVAVSEEDYEKASKYKGEMVKLKESLSTLQDSMMSTLTVEKRTDSVTIRKCLNIARGLLLSNKLKTLIPVLRTLCDDIIVQQLTAEAVEEDIQTKALECYALCCLFDKQNAQKGIHIFTTYILQSTVNEDQCDAEQLKIAVKAVVDLILIYGSAIISGSDGEGSVIRLTDVIQALVEFMDHEATDFQYCAVHGLCNLIISNRIRSPAVISRLILKWCNPTLDDEDSQGLRQIIGMMLEKLPTVPDAAEQLEKAVLPTIKTLLKAPESNPLSEVNVNDIMKFLVALCNICEEALNMQFHIALGICFDIKDNPQEEDINKVLTKLLLMLDIPNENLIIKDIQSACDSVLDDENIDDGTVLHNIAKFRAHLDTLKNAHVSMMVEEKVDEMQEEDEMV